MRRLFPILLLALSFGLIAPAASHSSTLVVTPGVYQTDVLAGANALQRFGVILERTQNVRQLQRNAPRVRALLTNFDRRLYVLSRYRVRHPNPAQARILNAQRARLARAAPGVTAVLSQFLDAALLEQEARVQRLLPIVIRRLNAFSRAAEG